jgi:dTDP-4-dehydrorhamnose reductase
MKVIVTGAKGQLGYDVLRELKARGYQDVIGIDIENLDITKEKDVVDFFLYNRPNVIIHCAGYTAVDKSEDDKDICLNVNVVGTKNLVKQANKYNAKFIYISTDYVFDGKKMLPYEIDDLPNPQSIYGKSKYLGELEVAKNDKHFIVRISWLFGKNGINFVTTMLKLSKEKEFINVVNDQYGSPTYTHDLSKLLIEFIETDKYGTYHATNEGICTWYEFAKEIFRIANINLSINPILTNQFKTKAKRPKNSVMSKTSLDKNGFRRLPNWKHALQRYLKEIELI